jgi:predicted NBD/HSP70 family sugar kinase
MLGRTVTELMPFHRLDDWFSSEETFLTQTDALSARGGSPLRRTHAPPGSIPGQPALLRAINDRAALELLVEHGPLSRAQIGRLTGLSKPTASQLLARLEEAGLVIPIGPRAGGRTAQLYEVNPGAAYVGAMDVTPAGIDAVIADITDRVVARGTYRTPGRAGADAVQAVHAALAETAETVELKIRDLIHVVAATPGALNPDTGQLGYAHHLPGWHQPRLVDQLTEALGVPVEVENDVNLAAIAESMTGAAQDVADFLHLWVSSGVGLALVIGGELYRGATGGAGEIGYMPVPGLPVPDHVGLSAKGAFQSSVGSPAVLGLARQLGLRARTAADALAAAAAAPGDPRHAALLDELARRLAAGLAAIIATLDPGLIVLSGEVCQAGGTALRDRVARQLDQLTIPKPELRLSTVSGNPVLVGATFAALKRARAAVFGSTVAGTPPRPVNTVMSGVHP